jgi:hypothetical protein
LNTGTNPWRYTGSANYRHELAFPTGPGTWGLGVLPLTNPTVNNGQNGTFSAGLTATNVEGDFDFGWQFRQYGTSTILQSIGSPCVPNPVTTISGNKIRVKRPTLATSTPVSLAFPSSVVGEPVTAILNITNGGGGTLNGTITGFDVGSPFSCATTNISAGPGATQSITCTFTPVSSSTVTDVITLSIPEGGGTGNQVGVSYAVTLGGTSLNKIDMTPSTLDFGEVAATRAKFMTITFKNNSLVQPGGTLNMSSALLSAGGGTTFTCAENCNFTLSANSTQIVKIKFNPLTIMETPLTLNVPLTTLNPAQTLTLTGQGIKPEFKVEER